MSAPSSLPPADELNNSMLETIEAAGLPDLATELGEVAFDSLLADGLVKDIPVIGVLAKLWKAGVTARDYVFVKKLGHFLLELRNVPDDKRREMVLKLRQDPAFGERAGEQVILLLDRLDDLSKPKLIGRAFRAFCEGKIG